jgi:hypothetical protein
LVFDPEDGDDMFRQNVHELLLDFISSHSEDFIDDTCLYVVLYILFSLFFFNLQSIKDPGASGKHKPEVTSNESGRSASSSNNEGTENYVQESPVKRRKKEDIHYIIKKVLGMSVASELAPQMMAYGHTRKEAVVWWGYLSLLSEDLLSTKPNSRLTCSVCIISPSGHLCS